MAKLAQQEAIGQRSPDGNMLYGPKAKEWGAFDPTQFVLLNGTKMSASVETQDADTPVSAADQQVVMHQPVSLAHPNEVASPPVRRTAFSSGSARLCACTSRINTSPWGGLCSRWGSRPRMLRWMSSRALTRTRGLVQNNLETLVKRPLAEIENYLFNAG